MENIEDYFGTCIAYWLSRGLTKKDAIKRAFWWDCVEMWNENDAWTETKVQFVRRYTKKYNPHDEIPVNLE